MIAPQACIDTYQDVERMLCQLCWRFVEKNGGDFEEAKSVANVAFVRAFLRFDSSKAQFTTWAWWAITHDLLSWKQRESKWGVRHVLREELDGNPAPCKRQHIAEQVSEDGKAIVSMVIESYDDFRHVLRRHGASQVRRNITRRCKAWGWTVGRISDAFAELREVCR